MDMSLSGLFFAALMAAQLLAVIAVHQGEKYNDDRASSPALKRKGWQKTHDAHSVHSLKIRSKRNGPKNRTAKSYCLAAVLIGVAISILMGPPPSPTTTSLLRASSEEQK
jgi:hypothetical protein